MGFKPEKRRTLKVQRCKSEPGSCAKVQRCNQLRVTVDGQGVGDSGVGISAICRGSLEPAAEG